MKKMFFTFLLLTQYLIGFSRSSDSFSVGNSTSNTSLARGFGIFDERGRLVKNTLNNKMIGNTGVANWDGISEDVMQLKTAMYIFWLEVFSENDNIERFKKVLVLSR
jgi:hypothetical protein